MFCQELNRVKAVTVETGDDCLKRMFRARKAVIIFIFKQIIEMSTPGHGSAVSR